MESRTDPPDLSALMAHQDFVRAQLRRFGVSSSAVDDLTQEVWLLAISRAQSLRDEGAARAWLSAVCRRLAANHRRSWARGSVAVDGREVDGQVQEEQLEHLEGAELLNFGDAALARLRDDQRDVLSLYGGGDLSMREVAVLIGEREPTVYARYRTAVAQVSRDLASCEGPRRETPAPTARRTPPFPSAQGTDQDADQGSLILYRCDTEMVLGRLGNVLIAHWRRRAFEQSSESLGTTLSRIRERLGGPLILINDVAANIPLPNASERRTMFSQMWSTRGATSVIVDIFSDDEGLKVVTAILTGLMSITRSLPALSFQVVRDVESARQWVLPHARCHKGPLPWQPIRDGILSMRTMSKQDA